MRRIILIVGFMVSTLLFLQGISKAQPVYGESDIGYLSSETQAQNQESSTTQEEMIEPPWFYFWPYENLNPYEYSTLGRSKETPEEQVGSTFGRSIEKPSNIEINKSSSESLKARREQIGEEEEVEKTLEETTEAGIETGEFGKKEESPRPHTRESKIYRWTDENGVLHLTNDIGSVPQKYRQQVKMESE